MNPLFADFGDIIGFIIFLAIMGFSVLSKLLGEGKQAKQKAEVRRRRAQAKAANPQAKSIESEIEEFLRQARGGGGAEAPRAAAPPVEAVVMEQKQAIRTLTQQSHDVEPVQPGQDFARDLESHVAEHIGKDSISQRDAHLAETVEMADERIEHHLEEVFDHQVGHLAHQDNTENTSEVAEGTDTQAWQEKDGDVPSTADELIELFKSPDSVKKMFIATEIFKRPEI